MATAWNKTYIRIFIAHVMMAIWAGLSFAIIPDRFMAALAAGGGFLTLNLLVAFWLRRDWNQSCIFWTNLLILFSFTLPMIIVRVMNPETPWTEVKLVGMDGPTFHRLSTSAFMAQIVLTLAEGFWRSRAVTFFK